MKVRALLDSEEKWTQGAMRRSADGTPVMHDSDDIACRCLIGAMIDSDNIGDSAWNQIYEAIGSKDVAQWNDACFRTFKDVRQLVETLDI